MHHVVYIYILVDRTHRILKLDVIRPQPMVLYIIQRRACVYLIGVLQKATKGVHGAGGVGSHGSVVEGVRDLDVIIIERCSRAYNRWSTTTDGGAAVHDAENTPWFPNNMWKVPSPTVVPTVLTKAGTSAAYGTLGQLVIGASHTEQIKPGYSRPGEKSLLAP